MLTETTPTLFGDFLTIEASSDDDGCSTTVVDFVREDQKWTTITIHAKALPEVTTYAMKDSSFLVASFGEHTKVFLSPEQGNSLVAELTTALEEAAALDREAVVADG
jgi:hypothetical protein